MALKPNTTYTIMLDTTVKTAVGNTLNKNYSFSFTISQAEYDNSNIKEYAIQLFRSQFGIDLCSPFIAQVYATSTNGRICDYWIAIAYLDNYPLRINLSYNKRYVAFKADNPEGTNLFNKVGSLASPIGTDE
jgi:hypothetical protein